MKLRKRNFFGRFIKDFFQAVSLLSMIGLAGVIGYWLIRLIIYNVTLGTTISGIVCLAAIVAIRVWNTKEEIKEEEEE